MDAQNSASSSGSRPVKNTNEARQGVTGHNVRTVLLTSLGAIVVIFAALWMFYFGR